MSPKNRTLLDGLTLIAADLAMRDRPASAELVREAKKTIEQLLAEADGLTHELRIAEREARS